MTTDNDDVSEGFRAPQVCKIVGITYRQLDYWARTGLLEPSISSAHGSGTQRRYSYQDVLGLNVIKELLDAGITLPLARRAIECLRNELGEDVSSANLVVSGTESVLAFNGEELFDILRGGQGVLSFMPLSHVVADLDEAIAKVTRLEPHQFRPIQRDIRPASNH